MNLLGYKKTLGLIALLSLSSVAQADLLIHQLPDSRITTPNATAAVTSSITSTVIPSEASIARLMQVMQVNDMIDSLIAQQQQMATTVQNLPNQLPKPDKPSIFSRKTQQQIQKVFDKYSQVFGQQVDPVKRRAELVNAYQAAAKQYYTQAEVDALLRFYDTPMGQQLLQKQSQVSTQFLQTALPTMVGNTSELEKILPDLQQDIEKIFN